MLKGVRTTAVAAALVGAGAVGAGAALASGWLPAPWSERRSLVPTTLTAMAILIMAVMAMATAIRHTRTVTVIPTRTIIDTAMRPVTTPMRDPIAALAIGRPGGRTIGTESGG